METWMPFATETAHTPIINAIERGDLNGAKKLVRKKIDKSADSRYPALLCWIQAHLPSATDRGEATLWIHLLADSKNKDPVSNEDDLEIYEHACEALADGSNDDELSSTLGRIRLFAVQKNPKNENLALYVMKECFKQSDFDACVQIAQVLCQNFPNKIQYQFWAIVCRMLYAQSPAYDPKMRQINSMVGARSLQSFAETTIKAKGRRSDSFTYPILTMKQGSALPVKALHNAREIELYHKALVIAGDREKLLSALRDPTIGVDSPLIKGDWGMMKTLVDFCTWGPSLEYPIELCRRLLSKACANDAGIIEQPMYGDWVVWEKYVLAVMEATDKGSHDAGGKTYQQDFMDLNMRFRTSTPAVNKTNLRNAKLAYVMYMTLLNPGWEDSKWTFRECEHDQTELILKEEARNLSKKKPYTVANLPRRLLYFVEYLHEYGHVPAVYMDLKPYFTDLTQAEREHLLGIAQIVMVERRGWSCDEYGKKGGAHDAVHFPPLVGHADQVHAVVNHFKFLYLNSHIIYNTALSGEDLEEMEGMGEWDFFECRHCRFIDNRDPKAPKTWFAKRHVECENCLTVIIKHGMDVYDHALNGWKDKQLGPLGVKPTDCHPGDEAAIMAAMALVKLGGSPDRIDENFAKDGEKRDLLFQDRHGPRRFIQAAALLEYAHSKSPANPQVLLLLVKIYSSLGAGSLAMRAYVRLNLKQIQNETLGYILLDRISSMHPHACADIMTHEDPVSFDPETELAKLHVNYKRFKEQIERNYWTCLEKGNYGPVFQLMDVNEKLAPSLAGAMSVVERRKILRMSGRDTAFTKSSHGYEILPKNVMKHQLEDNIDYNSFPSFELGDGGRADFVHVAFETGPKISAARVRADLLADELMMVAKAAFDSRANMTELILSLKNNFDIYREDESQREALKETKCTTEDENSYFQIALDLVDMVTQLGTRDRLSLATESQLPEDATVDMRIYLEDLKNATIKMRANFERIPDFRTVLHPLYTRWQVVIMIEAVDKLISHSSFQKNKKTTAQFKQFATEPAQELKKEIKESILKVKAKMQEGGYVDYIIESVEEIPEEDDELGRTDEVEVENYSKATIGRALRRVLMPEFIETFAAELKESWEESVEGLGRLV